MFGCHTALVLRRLRRVCERVYKRDPRFIVASATIANPRDHIRTLLGALLFLAAMVMSPKLVHLAQASYRALGPCQ